MYHPWSRQAGEKQQGDLGAPQGDFVKERFDECALTLFPWQMGGAKKVHDSTSLPFREVKVHP